MFAVFFFFKGPHVPWKHCTTSELCEGRALLTLGLALPLSQAHLCALTPAYTAELPLQQHLDHRSPQNGPQAVNSGGGRAAPEEAQLSS